MVRGGLLGDMLSHLLLCDCAALVPGGVAVVLAALLSILVARSTSKVGKEMPGEASCCTETCCKSFSGGKSKGRTTGGKQNAPALMRLAQREPDSSDEEEQHLLELGMAGK